MINSSRPDNTDTTAGMPLFPQKLQPLAEHIFSRLIDQRDRSFLIRLLRRAVPLHPYVHLLYQYRLGNIQKALQLSKSIRFTTPLQKKLQACILEINTVLERGWPVVPPSLPRTQGFNGRVLMALHNSLPMDGAGYAIRSQQILEQLQIMGLSPTAVTRPGYPWDLNQHRNKPHHLAQTVRDVTYTRLQAPGLNLGALETHYIKGYARMLAKMAKDRQIPVIHAHSNYLNGLAGTLAARQTGALGVYEMRGLWHKSRAVMEPGFENCDLYRYHEQMELAAAHQADHLVVISQALKDYLIKQGLKKGKISIIPNSVNTELFKPAARDEPFKAKLGIGNRIVVGFIGSTTDYEGVDLIIEAVVRLILQGLPLALLIVGSGYADRKLKQLAASSGAGAHIHFTGRVPFEEIRRYYSIIDIFPFPRRNLPVCRLVPPLKILEAMAMQKAVIVSNLPPLTEIVQHERTGLVCIPDDVDSLGMAIKTLVTADGSGIKLALKAREWVAAERSWSQIALKYVDTYSRRSSDSGETTETLSD